ncbi:hypothetical protein D9758_013982 [Tetrapyrgos nigripes]|uniref:Uncharacterized protein n=1 Tax=Tetrapyrgos nigripes TaxID=182062 RepID=A0A8H5G7Q4_9AGAR|nr:hypothetical protein D9758_013982 [Tetrapyrgos nigripes]
MELGPLNLYLAFLTHTNIQLYTRKQFLQSIVKLPVKVRRFSIGLAFEFQDYFLAFVMLDNVFQQPNWYLPSGPIPFELSIPDPVHMWLTFLNQVTQAIMARVNSPSCQRDQVSAIQVVCDMKIFHGIGIYVGLETFAMAGISPFLTEAEVFDCPSRTARLCLAYWEFVNMSYSPELCCWPPYSSRFRIVEAHERESKLFKNIVSKNTTDVAIGPLEYCGNGRMVKDSHGKLILTVCWYDPGSLSKGLVSQEYRGLSRCVLGLDKIGKKGFKMKKSIKTKNESVIQGILSVSYPIDVVSPSITSPPSKRRRLSADKHLALHSVDDDKPSRQRKQRNRQGM